MFHFWDASKQAREIDQRNKKNILEWKKGIDDCDVVGDLRIREREEKNCRKQKIITGNNRIGVKEKQVKCSS